MSADTVKEYMATVPEIRKEFLEELRALLRSYKLEEGMHYKMPTYSIRNMPMFAFASQKNYISFYVMFYDLLDPFADELKAYDTGKSCLRFKRMLSKDMELISKIIRHCIRNFKSSKFFKPEML